MSNHVEFRHLRYFQALAKELHFKRAADRVFISQPGLSRQIKQLEEYIGVALFERDKKHVALTKAGEYFISEANFLLNSLQNSILQTQNIAEGASGELKIGFVGSAMQNVIPNLILQSTKQLPELKFSFEELRNAGQVDKLLSNEIDLGFIRLNRVPDQLYKKAIFQDTFSLVLPKSHPITPDNFNGINEFADESFILFKANYSPAYHKEIISICEDAGFYPKIVHNSVHASTIYRLVENGLGISIVPSALKDGYNMQVKFLELKDIPQRAHLSVCWSKNNRNPALQKVLNILDLKNAE